MKIAVHVDGPRIRGNERQVIRIAAGLAARGHDVVVSCRQGGPVQAELQVRGIRTTSIRPRGDVDLGSALSFVGWLRRERPDAVLLTSWKRALVAGWAAHLARVSRVVLRVGGVQPIRRGIRGALFRHALGRWYHGIIANSHAVAERIAGAHPEVADRLHTVLNGMEPPAVVRPAALRSELRIPEGSTLLAAIGGCEHNKGWDLLIEAVARLQSIHAVLAGGGTIEQRRTLEQRARARGVGDRIHLLGPRSDVASVVGACDLFVLPSRSEGFSMAMLEAMFSGKPIVAADVGGTWEALAARESRPPAGWIVPVDDADALAATLAEVVAAARSGSPEIRTRAEEAEWRARNWFTLERMLDGYEAVLAGGEPVRP